jgi:hypothetical protein
VLLGDQILANMAKQEAGQLPLAGSGAIESPAVVVRGEDPLD